MVITLLCGSATDTLTIDLDATLTNMTAATSGLTQVHLLTARSFSSGALTGATTGSFSGTVTAGGFADGTATLSAGNISGGVNATFSGAVEGGSLTDGTATLSSGSITGGVAATFSGAVTGGSLTDGTLTASSGAISGATNITASGTVQFGSLSDGSISIAGFIDDDSMATASATTLATSESIKAYIDAQNTVQDLDFQGDSGGVCY